MISFQSVLYRIAIKIAFNEVMNETMHIESAAAAMAAAEEKKKKKS